MFTQSDVGRATILQAAARGHVEEVEEILRHGDVDMSIRDASNGNTALLCAARNGHTDVVDALLRHGVDVDTANWQKKTAIMFAAAGGHADTVRALLDAGARVDLIDRDGSSALDLAILHHHAQTAKQMMQRTLTQQERRVMGRYGPDHIRCRNMIIGLIRRNLFDSDNDVQYSIDRITRSIPPECLGLCNKDSAFQKDIQKLLKESAELVTGLSDVQKRLVDAIRSDQILERLLRLFEIRNAISNLWNKHERLVRKYPGLHSEVFVRRLYHIETSLGDMDRIERKLYDIHNDVNAVHQDASRFQKKFHQGSPLRQELIDEGQQVRARLRQNRRYISSAKRQTRQQYPIFYQWLQQIDAMLRQDYDAVNDDVAHLINAPQKRQTGQPQ